MGMLISLFAGSAWAILAEDINGVGDNSPSQTVLKNSEAVLVMDFVVDVREINMVNPEKKDATLKQVKLRNLGTSGGISGPADLAQVVLWVDDNGDNLWDDPFSSDPDRNLNAEFGAPSYDVATSTYTWGPFDSLSAAAPVVIEATRLYCTVNISADPTDNDTVQMQLPKNGLFFYEEDIYTGVYDGPSDTAINNPGIITIDNTEEVYLNLWVEFFGRMYHDNNVTIAWRDPGENMLASPTNLGSQSVLSDESGYVRILLSGQNGGFFGDVHVGAANYLGRGASVPGMNSIALGEGENYIDLRGLYPMYPGDIVNNDNAVDIDDTVAFIKASGSKSGDSNFNTAADYNKDSFVNVLDQLIHRVVAGMSGDE